MPKDYVEQRAGGYDITGSRLDAGTAMEELLLIWLASQASDWINRLEWLPL